MAAKKECPFTAEEMREMYEVEGMSMERIAEVSSVARGTVKRWILGVGISLNLSNAAQSLTEQKPSKNRLFELHWKQGLSLNEIGKFWASAIGRTSAYSRPTVRKWFEAYNMDVRLGAERMVEFMKSEKGRACARSRMREVNKRRTAPRKGASPAVMKKMLKAAVKSRYVKSRVIRECSWVMCRNVVTRKKSQLYSLSFCSKSCWAKYMVLHKRQRKQDAMLDRMQQEADAIMLKARNQESRNEARATLGLSPEEAA